MAAKKAQVYKCEHCGLVIEVLSQGVTPHCCGEKMVLQDENSIDASKEKHIPVLHDMGLTTKISIGSVEHPMQEDHYIEWVEVINGEYVNRKFLKPGDKPVAEFYVHSQPGIIVRAYCNKHGLWKA